MKGDKFYSGAHGNLSFHSFGTFNVGPGAVNSVQYVGEVPVGTAVTRAIIDVTAVTGNIANGARLDIGLVQKDLVDREPGQFTDDPDAFVDNHDPAVGTLVKELTDFAIVDEPDVWARGDDQGRGNRRRQQLRDNQACPPVHFHRN